MDNTSSGSTRLARANLQEAVNSEHQLACEEVSSGAYKIVKLLGMRNLNSIKCVDSFVIVSDLEANVMIFDFKELKVVKKVKSEIRSVFSIAGYKDLIFFGGHRQIVSFDIDDYEFTFHPCKREKFSGGIVNLMAVLLINQTPLLVCCCEGSLKINRIRLNPKTEI